MPRWSPVNSDWPDEGKHMKRKTDKPQPMELPECKNRKREQRRAREQMARRVREARGG